MLPSIVDNFEILYLCTIGDSEKKMSCKSGLPECNTSLFHTTSMYVAQCAPATWLKPTFSAVSSINSMLHVLQNFVGTIANPLHLFKNSI